MFPQCPTAPTSSPSSLPHLTSLKRLCIHYQHYKAKPYAILQLKLLASFNHEFFSFRFMIKIIGKGHQC